MNGSGEIAFIKFSKFGLSEDGKEKYMYKRGEKMKMAKIKV